MLKVVILMLKNAIKINYYGGYGVIWIRKMCGRLFLVEILCGKQFKSLKEYSPLCDPSSKVVFFPLFLIYFLYGKNITY